MTEPNSLDLIELPAGDAAAVELARAFYSAVFGWSFTSYGPGYVDTADAGTALAVNGTGGDRQQRAPLPVLYVADLDAAKDAVLAAGGTLVHDTYDFPGGRRFHFLDPAGNELAAWSE
ncbi:VOC family protein [Microbacterium sp. P04]|uniref:VOC family protein n=1 Tax=Microbacterium sp. P04 TaxID=3366947 RepID=UPI003745E90B